MPVLPPSNAKRVFQSGRYEVWQWDQALFDGSHAKFECITREDTVAIISFLDAQTILLIQEEQPGRDKPFFDVPGGCINKGESVDACAMRELDEETGYRAGTTSLFRSTKFSGMTRFEEHIVLAKGLRDGTGPHLDAGEKIELRPTPWKDAVAMCLRGELRRPEAMLAILAMEFDPEARATKERFLKG